MGAWRGTVVVTFCAMFTGLAPAAGSGQIPAADTTPGHALVLSGGGARGLAHAGALVALDELGYDPTLVVGTSMGAIIGALFAAGYSPDEIWSIVASENWLEQFSAEAIAVGQSRQPLRPTISFGLNRGRFYEGFVSTTRVNLRLVELLFEAGVRARNDFDRLPLRFRAVATDLRDGGEIVLAAGDLPRAVRASMAVPGAFAPVLWDGLVLGDGGIANNLPVTVARSLSAAPIIAVDVVRPRLVLEERGPLDLGVRALRLLIENARPDSIEPDILVLARLPAGFAEGRFPVDASGLLRAGHASVLEQVTPVGRTGRSARRLPGDPPYRVTRLLVESADPAATRLVLRIMAPTVGPYDPDEIVLRTAALYDTGLFSAVWPRLVFTEGDAASATLVIDAVPVARTGIAAALAWDNDIGGRAWASLLQQTSLTTPVELRAGVILGELSHRASIEGSIFSALLPGLIWNTGIHASDQRIRQFEGATIHDTTHVRRAGGWVGAELHGPVRNTFVSLLGRADQVNATDSGAGWSYGPYLRVSPPPQPDRVVGLEPIFEWEVRTGSLPYSRWHVRTGVANGVGRLRAAGSLHAHAATRTAPLDALPATSRDLAPWLRDGSRRSRFLAGGAVDLAYPTPLDGFVRLRLLVIGAADREGDRVDAAPAHGWAVVQQARWLTGGEITAIWPTVIGPLAVGAATGEGAGWRINLGIGAGF
jgi:predicted acylesterase/phospholipase RssA